MSDEIKYWIDKAEKLIRDKNYKKAFKYLNKALNINPRDGTAWVKKGEAYVGLKNYKKAIKCFDKALEILPNNAKILRLKGNAYYDSHEYEKAIECYEKSIKLDPNDSASWNNLGLALDEIKEYEKAIECYQKSWELDPKDSIPIYNQLELYYLFSLYDKTSEICETEKFLKEGDINVICGKIELAKGNCREAQKFFSNAKYIKIGDILPILWEIYTEFLCLTTSNSDATDYEKSLVKIILKLERLENKVKKEDILLIKAYYYWLAGLYFKIGDLTASIQKLEKCVNTKRSDKKFKGFLFFASEHNKYEKLKKEKIKEIDTMAKSLLAHLFNQSKPSWWKWWLSSPSPLYKWTKRVLFGIISVILLLTSFSPLITFAYPFSYLTSILGSISINKPIIWQLYLIVDLILIFLLLSPALQRLKLHEIEVEFAIPEFTPIVLKTMESILRKTESILEES